MKKNSLLKNKTLAFLMVGMLAAAPAFADKGEHGERGEGHSKHGHGKHESSDRDEGGEGRHGHFDENRRTVIHEYYAEEFSSGHCPPGLAKKHNGCMPPGQAKKWKLGRPLPRSVVYYDLPPSVVVQIGPPPAGHRYVRVASDILLMAIGTGMIVDAIDDLNR